MDQETPNIKQTGPNRRDFLRSMVMAALAPNAIAKAALGSNPYPWITDARVLDALKELDEIYEAGEPTLEFMQPRIVEEFILGIQTPKPEKIGDNYTMFASPFWQVFSGGRNKDSIQQAQAMAREALETQGKLEPRRRKLLEYIERLTGEKEPGLLRLEPEMRNMLKGAVAELSKDGTQCVFTERMFPYLQEHAQLIDGYAKAYGEGELERFMAEQHRRLFNNGDIVRASKLRRSPLPRGNDYAPSKEEAASPERHLDHFLNVPTTAIESSMGKPMAYTAMIHTRRDVRGHIMNAIEKLYPRKSRPLMHMHENPYPLKDAPHAYMPGSPGFITITDPPLALLEKIEEAKRRKEQSAGRNL